ncbi:type I phosphomannose isomerase catalytic subunit [Actinomycetospora chiangmaiensis]|uniref:type I phosphomannose isomerase catalytic subunit n=1 Tax=Actinomycetospora chiangmaiensis TaxID=402650 RepID=UPI00035C7222|nr:type I phosphomannose isomerase catalytic subunit [Actinomycetospora chiangmaiensis]
MSLPTTGPGRLPLHVTAPVAQHVFGGRAIADRLGRRGLPAGPVAETWEVSDVVGMVSTVTSGPWAGRPLHDLVETCPDELVGRGWRDDVFPVLTKFIDAAGALPVHLHPDDATARRLESAPHGKTEAWHVLDAAPGATALCGTRDGVDADRLRDALLAGDFDAVLRRLPVRAGQTVYVPGGTLHSFGPDTLVYEIEQTSDVQQQAMPWRMEDGSALDEDTWRANVEALLAEWDPDPRPVFRPGLDLEVGDDATTTVLTAGPYFALERWQVTGRLHRPVTTAVVLSNVGAPVRLAVGDHHEILDRASTVVLPAVTGEVVVEGPADVLAGYLPDLDRDVRDPLLTAGHGSAAIAGLGEGL